MGARWLYLGRLNLTASRFDPLLRSTPTRLAAVLDRAGPGKS